MPVELTLPHVPVPITLSEEDSGHLMFYKSQIDKAKEQRRQASEFFDDMTYEQDYYYNRQALNSYLRKKNNDADIRVNTGTTEKKVEAMMNELLSMNLQHEFRAFDEDDMEDVELGADFSDLVRRTNEIERDDDFWPEAVQELLSQRAVFIEEFDDSRTIVDKYAKGKTFGKKMVKTQTLRKRIVPGLNVFLGDITIPAYLFQTQPYIIKYSRMALHTAQELYGDLPNFKYVKPGMAIDDDGDTKDTPTNFRLGSLKEDEVEVICYESAPDDEYQLIINGIMMFVPGTPLPWDYAGYNMIMVTLKSMARNFAYGKPPVASAKTLQALDNETIRNLIYKFRQALKPPVAIDMPKNVYSRDIWDPSAVTFGLKKDKIQKLIDHDGITASEFQMYNLINDKITEFIGVSNTMQAIPAGSRTSATEIMTMQKQAMKMIGLAVAALMRMKRDCAYLRLYSVLDNYTKPKSYKARQNGDQTEVDEVYRQFTVNNSMFEDGRQGRKIIRFMDRNLSEEERDAVYQTEMQEEEAGQPTRLRFINAKKLRSIPFEWYCVVNSQERKGSALDKAMFQDQLSQALFIEKASQGQKRINWDSTTTKFERTWEAQDMFQRQAPNSLGTSQVMSEDEKANFEEMTGEFDSLQNDDSRKMVQGMEDFATQKPSVNSMINA